MPKEVNGYSGKDRMDLLEGVDNTLAGILKAMCQDYRLVAMNSWSVGGPLTARQWKKDDEAGYSLWKRAQDALKTSNRAEAQTKRFLNRVAGVTKDGECESCQTDGFEEKPDCADHSPLDLANDDAVETLHSLIDDAREICREFNV